MENLFNQKSLMISSIGELTTPEISYAPFVKDGKNLYIYISKAAAHYHHLLMNPQCSVMMIEDEKEAKTIFARQRVSFYCNVELLKDVNESIFESFGKRHGAPMVEMLRKMDFDMFKLDIQHGRLVKGFGKAYDITVNDNELVVSEVRATGHQMKHKKD